MYTLRLRVITFDVYNTILRIKGGSPGDTYAKVARTLGVTSEPGVLDEAYKYVFRDMKRMYPIYGVKHGMTARQWWGDVVRDTFLNAGYKIEMGRMEKLSQLLYDDFAHADTWEVYPYSVSVLKALKNRGLRLAIISNFDERLNKILQSLELDSYFDFIVTSHSCHYEKPDPRIFYHALEKAGVSPHLAAHVGDDIRDDYWGARNVGMHSFLLDRSGNFYNSDLQDLDRSFIIQQLTEIEQFLK